MSTPREQPEKKRLRLSEAYITEEEEYSLELLVDMLNINHGYNSKLMEACRTLGDYAEYVHRVRNYAKELGIEDAVDRTIGECIREGILKEFLMENRAEARAMSIFEYNEEEHMRLEREQWYSDGLEAGRAAEVANTERERDRADAAESRADAAESRADAAELRVTQAESENQKLKEEIARLRAMTIQK